LYGALQTLGDLESLADGAGCAAEQVGLSPTYQRWLRHSLHILRATNYLQEAQGHLRLSGGTVDSTALWKQWAHQRSRWSHVEALTAQADIARDTLQALPRILRGELKAVQVIFPGGSTQRMESLFRADEDAEQLNSRLADTLEQFIARHIERVPDARLRILEVGAGTGATSDHVLARLTRFGQHMEEYCYTDISPLFLSRAKRRYDGRHGYLTFKLLNIERRPAEQNIDEGEFDALIAANVLHATRDIRRTLRNAKAALRGGGGLFLSELLGTSVFLHLSFALLEGWWLYEDEELRTPGSPGLAPDVWRRTLQEEGFGSIAFPAPAHHQLGRQAIVAESDGIVRDRLVASSKMDREIAQAAATGMLLTPLWNAVRPALVPRWPRQDQRVVIVENAAGLTEATRRYFSPAQQLLVDAGDSVETLTRRLAELGSFEHLFWVAPRQESGEGPAGQEEVFLNAQRHGVLSLFRLVKALLASGYRSRALGVTLLTCDVYSIDPGNPTHSGTHGLMGSLAKELPQWNIRVIDTAAHELLPWETLLRLPADRGGDPWLWRDGHWYRRALVQCALRGNADQPRRGSRPYRMSGVYVVIGGAGGIGEVWSSYVARHFGAQVVWIGRRALDRNIQAKLARLSEIAAPRPYYICADACDREALQRACDDILQRHGHIDGVVHSAFVLRDRSLVRMTEQEFCAALDPKVAATLRVGQVFGKCTRDFLLFFSSLQSFGKLPGQSNYAAGSAFQDAYARWLARHCTAEVTLINWGYWGSTGAVAAESYCARMKRQDVESIEPDEALTMLRRVMQVGLLQAAYLKSTPKSAAQRLEVDLQESVVVYPRAS
jgi:NAD(P)-dependent dehydrogenase (short-subunit alcohol dehydrogenase family)/SAM-dependent methyltransferase